MFNNNMKPKSICEICGKMYVNLKEHKTKIHKLGDIDVHITKDDITATITRDGKSFNLGTVGNGWEEDSEYTILEGEDSNKVCYTLWIDDATNKIYKILSEEKELKPNSFNVKIQIS